MHKKGVCEGILAWWVGEGCVGWLGFVLCQLKAAAAVCSSQRKADQPQKVEESFHSVILPLTEPLLFELLSLLSWFLVLPSRIWPLI